MQGAGLTRTAVNLGHGSFTEKAHQVTYPVQSGPQQKRIATIFVVDLFKQILQPINLLGSNDQPFEQFFLVSNDRLQPVHIEALGSFAFLTQKLKQALEGLSDIGISHDQLSRIRKGSRLTATLFRSGL